MKRIKGLALFLVVLCLLSACKQQNDHTVHYENGYEYREEWIGVRILSHEYDPSETHVIVPETLGGKPVVTLGDAAFSDHTGLVSLTLPENLQILEGDPFTGCVSLQECTIPKNVKGIPCNIFYECTALKSIRLDPENEYFTVADGVLFDKEMTRLICYPYCKTDESYALPKSVKWLRFDAFGERPRFKRLTVYSGLQYFDEHMFDAWEDFTLVVEQGSEAEARLQACDINYKLIED